MINKVADCGCGDLVFCLKNSNVVALCAYWVCQLFVMADLHHCYYGNNRSEVFMFANKSQFALTHSHPLLIIVYVTLHHSLLFLL